MKKSLYVLAIVGLVVMSASVFLVARLSVTRRGQIRELLKRSDLSFQTLRNLYSEIVKAGETGGDIEKAIGERLPITELEEEYRKITQERENVESQIRDVEASLVEEDLPETSENE